MAGARAGLPARLLKYGFLGIVLLTVIFPAYVALITSLKTKAEVFTSPVTWFPSHLQFGNYVDMFQRVPLGRAFWNSFLIAGGSTVVVLVTALPAAYALARFDFPGRRAVMFGILSIIMFSPIVVIVSLFQLMSTYGLVDKWYAIAITDAAFALPFSVWIMVGYLRTIPKEIEEAALVDGCTPLRAFRDIVLPLALPGVATVVIFAFVQAWNEFLVATSLLTDETKFPLPVAMFNFVGQHGVQWEFVSGAVVLSSVPVLALFWMVQRGFVRGLTFGAVK
jgi:ABC-type glycerol-3-phosphate transport system permease component